MQVLVSHRVYSIRMYLTWLRVLAVKDRASAPFKSRLFKQRDTTYKQAYGNFTTKNVMP